MTQQEDKIQQLIEKINAFREERDWRQFHNPKNLAISLSLEASEVLELFQWLDLDQSANLSEEKKAELADELADVATYLLYLCHEFDIDIFDAIEKKIEKNAKKYPVSKAKGSATKYTKL
jgi:NTP pyrophosphatase (non-canonical NTP hydrolase)